MMLPFLFGFVAFGFRLCSTSPPRVLRPLFLTSSSNLPSQSDIYSASSTKTFANALNLTIEEVKAKQMEYRQSAEKLHNHLSATDLDGETKHELHCRHRFQYGRHPFICRNCWSYLPICVCKMSRIRSLPATKVILWTHHKEWGSPSNTGCILPLTLENTSMLMKGLPEHDEVFDELLHQTDILPVVLWTNDNKNKKCKQRPSCTIEELKNATKNRILLLVAVEGTWRNARRMVSKLPRHVQSLTLTREQVFGWSLSSKESSLLRPLRHSKSTNGGVCTAEAVVSALLHIERLTLAQGEEILSLVGTKVDLTTQYQGKVPRE